MTMNMNGIDREKSKHLIVLLRNMSD